MITITYLETLKRKTSPLINFLFYVNPLSKILNSPLSSYTFSVNFHEVQFPPKVNNSWLIVTIFKLVQITIIILKQFCICIAWNNEDTRKKLFSLNFQ